MSRKELFTGVNPGRFRDTSAVQPVAPSVRRFEDALGAIRDRTSRAEEIEKALTFGDRIVEIDPALIEPSPIPDRLRGDPTLDADLLDSLREKGQQVPVLLRPHSTRQDHYVTVYGHRRIAALRVLGLRVRALVVSMSDEDAYVAQGVENSAREDLSFIERALFAARLDDAGVARPQIATALHTRQSHVSTMIALARRIPRDVIDAIGATPGIGRRRWEELDALLATANAAAWREAIANADFSTSLGETRFAAVMAAVSCRRSGHQASVVATSDGTPIATVERSRDGGARITLKRAANKAGADGLTFADWLEQHMVRLRDAWERGERPVFPAGK